MSTDVNQNSVNHVPPSSISSPRNSQRSILWIFLAFVLGFTLPVFSCVGTGFLTLGLLSRMGSESVPSIGRGGDVVAVIHLNGIIAGDTGDPFITQGITPERTQELLDQAAANPAIKAVVVRVNSPGGSVVASDEIYHAFLDFEKPLVIWMGETAASGGYYIACGGDYIFAHPDTLTGSIGVISQFINVDDLLDDLGVDVVVLTAGDYKDFGSTYRDMTEEERALWQTVLDEIYDNFVQVVAESRDLDLAEARELADGKIYTGRQARDLDLVDDTGTLADAIAKAAELGNVEGQPQVIDLKPLPSLLETVAGLQGRPTMPTPEEILNWAGTPAVKFLLPGP